MSKDKVIFDLIIAAFMGVMVFIGSRDEKDRATGAIGFAGFMLFALVLTQVACSK